MANIVTEGEIACNKQFLLFSQCFLPYMVLIFHFKMSSAICFSLDQSKILSSGDGLTIERKACVYNFQTELSSYLFTKRQILVSSKLKAFADHKLNAVVPMISLFDREQNTVGKEEMLPAFSSFPSVFQSLLP